MTDQQLLDAIGDAKGIYVREAQTHREGTAKSGGNVRSLRKLWLIAAIIALMLVLVGCVAYVLSLKDMKLGEHTVTKESHYGPGWEVIEETQITWERISLQGFSGSPNLQAAQEWYVVMEENEANTTTDEGIPDSYASYGCRTWEMVDKLNDILESHALKLVSPGLSTSRAQYEILWDALKIAPVCKAGEGMTTEYGSGGFSPEGAFHLWVDISFDDEEEKWIYPISVTFFYSPKGYFGNRYTSVQELESFQEWEYTLPDGNKVLIAMNEEKALIFADREDAFLSLLFDTRAGIDHMTKEMVEKIVSVFDFSVCPQSLTEAEMAGWKEKVDSLNAKELEEYNQWKTQYQESLRKEGYADWVKEYLGENNTVSADLGFAFLDIDANGSEELLIGRDGYVINILIERDGKIEQLSDAYYYMYPCEDHKFVGAMGLGAGKEYYCKSHSNGESMLDAHIRYVPGHPEGEFWLYDAVRWNQHEVISREVFDDILHSYIRLPLRFIPLWEYPLDVAAAPSETFYTAKPEDCENYENKVRIRLTDMEERWSRWAYDLRDLDGNGQAEMIWREDDRYFVYTIADGTMCSYGLTGDMVTICEGGYVETVFCYGPVNRTYRYYRIQGDKVELVEYLRYDVDADPENPWSYSEDRTGQDTSMKPLSERQFNAIRESYSPMELDMKPITEYPLSDP